jgi:carboxypeptidase family protein
MMRFRKLFVILTFLVTSAYMALSQSKLDSSTGIQGIITVSPARPGPIKIGSEIPDGAPLPNATFSVTSESGTVKSFTTNGDGRFRVLLSAGHYTVLLAEHRFPKPCGPFEVDVLSGKMTDVEWRCDSGMR